MKNISKTKKVYYFLIILGFILPISRVIFMQVPKMLGQLFSQLFTAILFPDSPNPYLFNWTTLFAVIAVITLVFQLFSFIIIQIEKNEKNMRYYVIATLFYVLSGTLFLYNQTPDMLFVVIVYYVFLTVSAFFVKHF